MSDRSDSEGTILVADDDPQVRRLIARLLERAGFSCIGASDGLEAVELADALRPDLVMLDIAMPNLNGTSALARLRESFHTRFTPVIYVTGNGAAGVMHLLAGADDYVTKPFKPDELVARVQVALRRARTLGNRNPLTGLPGNDLIVAEVDSRLASRRPFAFLYVDLDHFKAFNDNLGFVVGDEALRLLRDVIVSAVHANPSQANFVGHIGGDDFVVLTEPALLERLSYQIILGLETGASALDPRSAPRHLSVTVGAVIADSGRFSTSAEVSSAAARMKSAAKRVCGSHLAIDGTHQRECV